MNAHHHSATARNLALILMSGAALAACATPHPRLASKLSDGAMSGPPSGAGGRYKVGAPYQIKGLLFTPRDEPGYDRQGIASWYGPDFHGRKTANGEVYDMNALTAAHPTLPIPSYAQVTNLATGRTLLVRINDRGPYAHDRIIDMSRQSARLLGFHDQGTTRVRVAYVGPAPLDGNEAREQRFLAAQGWYRRAYALGGAGGDAAAMKPRTMAAGGPRP